MTYIIPAIIAFVLVYALIKKQPPYGIFLSGARDGMNIAAVMFPPLVAILTAVYMLRASGALDLFISFLSPITHFMPAEVLPLAIIRPLSGSGALGILTDILNTHGADGNIGRIASVMMGSTETTFYCIAVYFAKTRAEHTLRAIPFAALGDLTGLITAVLLINFIGM